MRAILWLVCCFAAVGSAWSAERVVSLSPTLTEIIFALGEGDKLVGRSSACDFPKEAAVLPVAGDFALPAMEALVSLNPDLVVADILVEESAAKQLRAMNIPVEMLPLVQVADYPAAVRKLGELLGCTDKAEKMAAEFEAERQRLLDAQKKLEKPPVVLILLWDDPWITCGKQSFLNDSITLAGGRNLAADEDKGYFNASGEWLILQQPDVVILMGAPETSGQPWTLPAEWRATPAVRSGRVYRYGDDGRVSRLGPRWFAGVKALQELIAR